MTLFSTNSLVMNGFFDFSKDDFGFVDSLKVMLLGLIIIFIVTGVLILCVAALNKMSAGSKRSADKRNAGKNK
ncbi:unknown [Clostridium sp. CAG:138]|nr:unknown [Clostridium sp. CAG:138]